MIAPQGVTIIHLGMGSAADAGGEFLAEEGLKRTVSRIPDGVRHMVQNDASVIVQAGVPHITVFGWGFEEKLRAEVAAITDTPFIMDPHASIAALKALGMSRVLMVSPFTDPVSVHVAEYVRHGGIEVTSAYRVGTQCGAIHGLSLGVVYQEVKAAYQGSGKVDGIWLPGAAMPTIGVIETLEQDLGVPVVSSKQAMVWAALGAANVCDEVPGCGSLFQHSG